MLHIPPDTEDFTVAMRRGGVSEGLRVLNERVAHRYTAVYRLSGETLRNVHLHDRQGAIKPEYLAEVPLAHSFCQFVLRDGCFLTEQSSGDGRLDGHPYQGKMVAYHGLPLLDDSGELYGTLCHFDVEARPLPEGEFEYLQKVARLLPVWLPKGHGA